MKKIFRVLSVFSCVFILICSVVPISVSAIGGALPRWYWDYLDQSTQEYLEIVDNRYELIQPQVNDAISDSNLSDTEKYNINVVYATQELYFNELDRKYSDAFQKNPVVPDTFSFGASCECGIYQSALDFQYHSIISYGFSNPGDVICQSDEFTLVFNRNDISGYTWVPFFVDSNTYLHYGCYRSAQSWNTGVHMQVDDYSDIGYFTSLLNHTYSGNAGGAQLYCVVYKNTNAYRLWRDSFSSVSALENGVVIGSFGRFCSIPESDVDTSAVWDYYNNELLPDLKQNYPDVPDDYYFFPDGYQPQDPPEPATFPNGGISVGDIYNIDIDIITVTDSNGEPVTNSEGETVTETQIVTETRPTDAVYRFEIPTLSPLSTVEATLPSISLPQKYVTILGSLYDSIYRVLDSSGLLSVLPLFVGVGVACYIIYRVGG